MEAFHGDNNYVARRWVISGRLIKAVYNGRGEYVGVYNGRVITKGYFKPEGVYNEIANKTAGYLRVYNHKNKNTLNI